MATKKNNKKTFWINAKIFADISMKIVANDLDEALEESKNISYEDVIAEGDVNEKKIQIVGVFLESTEL